jgi:hypothetical protein
MGGWGVDPFENDTAAVWFIFFEEASADRRPGMIREALTSAIVGRDVYLDSDFAFEAIAAAAVVAAQMAAAPATTWPYVPAAVPDGSDPFGRDADLLGLVVTALDRIAGDRSEWRGLWQDGGRESLDLALGMLQRIREMVQDARGGDQVRVTTKQARPADDESGAGSLKYLTYTKYNPVTGQVFTGRFRGRGDPEQILAAYDRHHQLTERGFGPAELDVWIAATKPYALRLSDRSYQAIRGREQLKIDAHGGARRQGGRTGQ